MTDTDRIKENAEKAMECHKKHVENWREGGISECWEDESGFTCVRYESGEWWHYRGLDTNSPEWW